MFLDIDGVMNSSQWYRDRNISHNDSQIDPRTVELLNQIAPADTTRIVISSTRKVAGRKAVANLLRCAGVQARVVGVTPDLVPHGDYSRSDEIAAWLADNSDRIGTYVIIDDDAGAGIGHTGNFIKTDSTCGLTEQHVMMAREIFGRVK